MNFDKSKVSKYDLNNVKVGDKVIIGSIKDLGGSEWEFNGTVIKSISAKRGDITLANGKRYQKDGRKMGVGRWDRHHGDNFFEYTQENIATINSYLEARNEAGYIVQLFRKIEKQGFKMLYDLTEDKISVLHKTLEEIFGDEND